MTIRPARAADAEAIAEIRRSSAEAAQWDSEGYDVTVAEVAGAVVGFLVSRAVHEQEIEILNLAVAPEHRRRGVARGLVLSVMEQHRGDVFLEVRESNSAARKLYEMLGFQQISRRANYYDHPPDAGIVMKFHSC